jgi:succinyl-CoA synthetase beta subunit
MTLAAELGGPVALKVASADIEHKSDIGGVMLDVAGETAVGAAFDAIMGSVRRARPEVAIEGILVSPMRTSGVELLVGTLRDSQWGAVMAVGLGGIWVEALGDTQLTLLPTTTEHVKVMLSKLRGTKLLHGFRGAPPVDLEKLAQVIVAIGKAALELGPDLVALEVNPLWARESHVEALDGLAEWAAS